MWWRQSWWCSGSGVDLRWCLDEIVTVGLAEVEKDGWRVTVWKKKPRKKVVGRKVGRWDSGGC